MKITLKKTCQNNLYTYIHVSGHKGNNDWDSNQEIEQQYLGKDSPLFRYQNSHELETYLHCACFLTAGLKKYAISDFNNLIMDYTVIGWRYEVLANDFKGMGIDKGFQKGKAIFFEFDELIHSGSLFQEKTIFGIKEKRREELSDLLSGEKRPDLENFLKEGEIFIDIVKGKDYGYFNSFLIKSKKDLDKTLRQFAIASDAGN